VARVAVDVVLNACKAFVHGVIPSKVATATAWRVFAPAGFVSVVVAAADAVMVGNGFPAGHVSAHGLGGLGVKVGLDFMSEPCVLIAWVVSDLVAGFNRCSRLRAAGITCGY